MCASDQRRIFTNNLLVDAFALNATPGWIFSEEWHFNFLSFIDTPYGWAFIMRMRKKGRKKMSTAWSAVQTEPNSRLESGIWYPVSPLLFLSCTRVWEAGISILFFCILFLFSFPVSIEITRVSKRFYGMWIPTPTSTLIWASFHSIDALPVARMTPSIT